MQIARFKHGAEISYGIVDEAVSGAGLELVQLAGDPLFSGFETTGERLPFVAQDLVAPVLPRSKVLLAECSGSEVGFTVVPNTAVAGPGAQLRVAADGLFAKPGLALIVGALAKDLQQEQALSRVFGFCLATQFAERSAAGFDTSRDGFLALGPVLETDPELADVRIEFTAQAAGVGFSVADLPVGIAAVVAQASAGRTLLPGDVIIVAASEFVAVGAGEVVTAGSGLGALKTALV